MTGPFDSEAEVLALPDVRDVYAMFDADPGPGKMAPHNHALLIRACVQGGAELGAYDRRILLWLAGSPPATCAVVAGLISAPTMPGVLA